MGDLVFFNFEEKNNINLQKYLISLIKNALVDYRIFKIYYKRIKHFAKIQDNFVIINDEYLYLINSNGEVIQEYILEYDSITCLLPFNDSIILIGTEEQVILIDIKEKKQIIIYKKSVNCMCLSLENTFIFCTQENEVIKTNIQGRTFYKTRIFEKLEIKTCIELPDKKVILGCKKNQIIILNSDFVVQKIINSHNYWITKIISIEKSIFVSLAYDPSFKIFSSNGDEIKSQELQGWASPLVNYKDNKFLTGSRKGKYVYGIQMVI